MGIYYVLAFLMLFNIFLHHGHRISVWAFNLYRKVVKPKFAIGDRVIVRNVEVEVVAITKQNPPYIYYCCPVHTSSGTFAYNPYVKQRDMKSKTGIFKELD